jgi:hypothetical protein
LQQWGQKSGHPQFPNEIKKEIKMSAKRLFVVFLAIAVLVPVSIGGRRLAIPAAHGEFVTTSTIIHSITEDKFNEVVELSSTVVYDGALEGTSTVQGTMTVDRYGSATFKGVETFTGLVNGMPGTLSFDITGSSDLYQAVQLTNTITSAGGALASLHGQLSKQGMIKDNGPVGTYTGQIDH